MSIGPSPLRVGTFPLVTDVALVRTVELQRNRELISAKVSLLEPIVTSGRVIILVAERILLLSLSRWR